MGWLIPINTLNTPETIFDMMHGGFMLEENEVVFGPIDEPVTHSGRNKFLREFLPCDGLKQECMESFVFGCRFWVVANQF